MKIKIRKADQVFSRWVRTRDKWTCQRCHRGYEVGDGRLQCAHCFGRRKESVRFDPENTASLCVGCHLFLDQNHEDKRAFFIKRLGEENYNQLMIRSNITAKKDDKMVVFIYSRLLKEMENA